MMRIKSKQRLYIRRFFNDEHVTVSCTYGELKDATDSKTSGAVVEALKHILHNKYPYKQIRAKHNGIDIEVNLLD